MAIVGVVSQASTLETNRINSFFVCPHSFSSDTKARQTLHLVKSVETLCVGLTLSSLIDSSVPRVVCFACTWKRGVCPHIGMVKTAFCARTPWFIWHSTSWIHVTVNSFMWKVQKRSSLGISMCRVHCDPPMFSTHNDCEGTTQAISLAMATWDARVVWPTKCGMLWLHLLLCGRTCMLWESSCGDQHDSLKFCSIDGATQQPAQWNQLLSMMSFVNLCCNSKHQWRAAHSTEQLCMPKKTAVEVVNKDVLVCSWNPPMSHPCSDATNHVKAC